MNTKIIRTGHYLPKTKITNTDFESVMDTNDEWIRKRTGIRQRRFSKESATYMATQAAHNACIDIDVESIDCIIVASYTPDTFIPTIANAVRANLNITRPIASFDLNAACSGFLFALQTANAYLLAKIYKRILVIGVDKNSQYLNFEDRSTSILFGDGAGAVLVELGDKGIIDCILGGEADNNDSITMKNATHTPNPFIQNKPFTHEYFKMKGPEVFKFATRIITQAIKEILIKNSLTIDEIDYIVAHQANKRILESAARSLNCSSEKFLTNIENYGNTSSASVPILLDERLKDDTILEGMTIILIAFGGGLTYGTALVEM
ncbi:beta-ketoacyl-ACP synthase III [Erysipelothrix urinaevulpis]|uniref:beta-ketoacyl-ACP synthase III n=1 Tax=Erysipelothrix urinaevulpis TaxID=2683717 RepID=UPI00135869F4|nr:beta-ketoacyl-ACP synthase III [Erysipelothrix urinaevulpis]